MVKGTYKNNATTTDLYANFVKTANVNVLRTTDLEGFQLRYKTS